MATNPYLGVPGRERSAAYWTYMQTVADQPALIRAVDVRRLVDETPPSFDKRDFCCFLLEENALPPRARAAIEHVRDSLPQKPWPATRPA